MFIPPTNHSLAATSSSSLAPYTNPCGAKTLPLGRFLMPHNTIYYLYLMLLFLWAGTKGECVTQLMKNSVCYGGRFITTKQIPVVVPQFSTQMMLTSLMILHNVTTVNPLPAGPSSSRTSVFHPLPTKPESPAIRCRMALTSACAA